MAATPVTPATRALRRRIALLIAGVITAALVVIAVFTIASDRRLRDEQVDSAALRTAETVASAVGFTGGELVIAARDADIGGALVALAARPPLTATDVPNLDQHLEDFAALSVRELRRRLVDVVESLRPAQISELQRTYDVATRRELIVAVVADPQPELVREATRRYVAEQLGPGALPRADVEIVNSSPALDTTDPELGRAIEQVVAGAEAVSVVISTMPDHAIRIVPLRDGVVVRGAAVVAIDEAPFDDAHATLRLRVVVAAAVMALAGSGAAWWIAGRAVAPAARAIAQQERFLGDAAHELRTPIAAIRATAERGQGVGGDETAALGRIVELAAGAGALTDDLLTLAHMDAGALDLDRRPVRLDLLVEAAVEDRNDVVLDLDEATVVGDARLLERVVVNLVENAVRHGHATEVTPVEVLLRDGVLTVSDAGPGIEASRRSEVFDRFASAPGSTGHGLGLALVKWIVEGHGWSIDVGSSSRGGAAFRIATA